jgi:uncharacterized damage-inducible protein DinB
MLDQIRALYDYNAWANVRVLGAADGLTDEEFARELEGAGSLRTILTHVAGSQAVWLERFQGRSPASLWDASLFPDLATLHDRWDDVERVTREYVATLRDGDLDEIVAYTNFQGERWAYPRWQQMIHQVNHATQHRSEAAVLLTQLGRSPGNLDFLICVDEQGVADRD